jgi:hypothetical protein
LSLEVVSFRLCGAVAALAVIWLGLAADPRNAVDERARP